jgi:threonine/homoserine/homoserine lactone efflux protein
MTNELTGFMLAGLALTGSPGPANFGLAATGAAFGLRGGVRLSAGIVVGVEAVMLLTASGLTGLILAQPALGPAVQIAATAYIAFLAWKIATAPPLTQAQSARPPSFGTGLFLGVGNPKSYAAMSALYSGFMLAADRPLLDVALKMLVLFAMVVPVNVTWLFLGSVLTRRLRDPAASRAINIGFAVLLVASVAFAFLR